MTTIMDNKWVEELKKIKEELDALYEKKRTIEANITSDLVMYENVDGTWTRFKRINQAELLFEKKLVFVPTYIEQYKTEIKVLKNPPKELNK